jgi:hypothetical protein
MQNPRRAVRLDRGPWVGRLNATRGTHVVRYTIEELLDIAAPYATNEEVAGPLPVPGSTKALPCSNREAPFGIAAQGAKKDVKGGKKRQNWHPQWVAVVAGYDYDNDKKADDSGKEYIATVGHRVKRQA